MEIRYSDVSEKKVRFDSIPVGGFFTINSGINIKISSDTAFDAETHQLFHCSDRYVVYKRNGYIVIE